MLETRPCVVSLHSLKDFVSPLPKCSLTELLAGETLEQADVQVASLLRDVGGKGRDVGFWPAGPPGVHEGLMVPSLAVVLPDELLAQFDLLPLLVRLEIPEPVFIRGPERVHKHQAPLLVHRELFLAIHVNQAAFPDLCVETSIDFEDRPYEGVELRAAQLRNPQRFVFRELAVHFFQLRRHFDKRVREGLSVLRRMTSRKADRFRPDFACLNPIVERAGHVVSGDHLEGNQEIVGGRRNAIVFGNHLDAAHPHSVPVDDPQEVRADAEPLTKLEPMGRRAAERLSFMRDERRDHFVEHADLVREDELEAVLDDARIDDVRDGAEFVPCALVCRRLPPGEESCGTEDERPRAYAGNRLLRSEIEEALQELGVLDDFLAPGSSRDDHQIEVGKLVVDLVREELHPQGTGDLLLHGTEADREVEFRVDLLRLRKDLVHSDRVELLDTVEDKDTDSHRDPWTLSRLNRSGLISPACRPSGGPANAARHGSPRFRSPHGPSAYHRS